jgi:hypothetical protein
VGTIVVTASSAGAAELPPLSVPDTTDVTAPTVPTLATLPPVTVPVLDVPVDAPATPVVGTAASPTSTAPGTSERTEASAPSAPPVGAPSPSGGQPLQPAVAAAPAPPSGPAPEQPPADTAHAPVASPALRTVASERARQFAFPFTLALLVVGFLAVHGRLTAADPRLVTAPVDDDRRTFR